jgi:hypothetical protein
VLLTAYADSAPGTACPSKVDGCPHKTAAVTEKGKHRGATLDDLDDLRKRLDKLEAKGRSNPITPGRVFRHRRGAHRASCERLCRPPL